MDNGSECTVDYDALVCTDDGSDRQHQNGPCCIQRPPLRVLMSSMSHNGRAQSLLAIASELVRRNHKVTFVCHRASFYNALKTLASGRYASEVNIVNIGTGEPIEEVEESQADQLRKEISTKDNTESPLRLIQKVVELLTKHAARAAPLYHKFLLDNDDFDIIVADLQALEVLTAREFLNGTNIPPVVLNHPILAQGELNTVASQSGYYPAANSRNLYDLSLWNRMSNVVLRRIGSLLTRSITDTHFKSMLESVGLPPSSQIITAAKPILVGTAIGFEIPFDVPSHLFYTGPMIDESMTPQHLSQNNSHVQWASSNSSCPGGVFYASLGTTVDLDTDEINAVARALLDAAKNKNVICFLWSLKQTQQDLLQPDVKNAIQANDRFKLATFVAQRLFLRWAPVVGHLTHGGVASVSESLYYGVPLVVMPFLFDQIDLAARVEAVHAGIDVGSNRPHDEEAILGGIRAVCSDGQFRRGAERIGQLFRRSGGTRRAADVIEDVAQFGSQHLIPLPYRENAPWYVYGDTDVLLVLTSATSIVVFVVIKLLFSVVRRCKKRSENPSKDEKTD